MTFKDFRFAIVVALFALTNIYATQIPYLGILITLIEYIIVYYLIGTNKYLQALIALVTFTSVSLDMDSFIYESGVSPFERWTFVNGRFFLNILYTLTCGILYFLIKRKYTTRVLTNLHVAKLSKWLKLLIVSGILSICLGLILDFRSLSKACFLCLVIIFSIIIFDVFFNNISSDTRALANFKSIYVENIDRNRYCYYY